MNVEQLKSMIRWLGMTVGGFIAGWFASKGILDKDTWLGIFNSETTISLLTTAVLYIWSFISKSAPGLVVAASSVPAVTTVVVSDPELAKAIAAKNPQATVKVN